MVAEGHSLARKEQMKVGDLVSVFLRGNRVTNVIVSVVKRRNAGGTHDAFVEVLGCGKRPFHYLNVEMVNESR